MKHYVYVMSAVDGLTKIGISMRPKVRRHGVQIDLGKPVTIVASIEVDSNKSRMVEKAAHKHLTELGCHVRGEWFRAPPVQCVDIVKDFVQKLQAFPCGNKIQGEMYSQGEVVELLRCACEIAGGIRPYARKVGVSPQHISQVCEGKTVPSPVILNDLGLSFVGRMYSKEEKPAIG